MTNFDFGNPEQMKNLKREINAILEERIRKAELDSTLNSLSEMPFGAIKNVFEGVTDKLYESKKGKKLIARYINTIRENKNLSDAYTVNEFVHHAPHVDNAEIFLSEALNMTESVKTERFDSDKKKMVEIVKEAIKMSGVDNEWVNECLNKNFKINESIDYLVANPKRYGNLAEYVNNFNAIKLYLEENMHAAETSDAEKSGRELMDELNESMEGLKDWEKNAVKDIAIAKLSKSDLSGLFESYKKRCNDKLSEAIDADGQTVENVSHLKEMRDRLMDKEYNPQTLCEDILTLAELEKTLEE